MTANQPIVLFVCVHNSGRSQMAEAFFNYLAKVSRNTAVAYSAGTQPGVRVNPTVVLAMAELAMDLSQKQPALLTQDMLDSSQRVITMGCNVEESCPANMVVTEDWALEDPKDKPLEKVIEIRDEVKRRVEELIDAMGQQGL
jgi:arsenate reductase